MKIFLAKRIWQTLILIFGAITIVFIVLRAIPGDPALLMVGANATPAEVDQVRIDMGLNEPLWIQYFQHLWEVVQGDFGESWRLGGDALAITLSRLPATLLLAFYAFVLTVALGVPLGIYCSRRPGTIADRIVSVMSLTGQALPAFWVGIMLILVFSRWLNLVPAVPDGTFKTSILPAFTLALPFIGWLARLVRNGALEEIGKDYVRTAKAKGLAPGVIFYVHVMRNTLVPIVTALGFILGNFIADAVIIENVFSWPGIGSLMVDSITNRDYAIAEATVIAITVAYVIINLVVDLLYFAVDPRLTPETSS